MAVVLATGSATTGAGFSQQSGQPVLPMVKHTGASTPSLVGWKDLETWTRETGAAPDTEIGLGLVLSGTAGTAMVSFAATKLRSSPGAPPKDVALTVVPIFDSTRVRWASLSFVITGKDKKQTTIALSERVTTNPPGPFGPGDSAVNANATMTVKEFAQLADAQSLTATVLGLQVAFRPDQVKAVRAFGERAGLIRP